MTQNFLLDPEIQRHLANYRGGCVTSWLAQSFNMPTKAMRKELLRLEKAGVLVRSPRKHSGQILWRLANQEAER